MWWRLILRPTAKWFAVVTLGCAVIWVVSGWYQLQVQTSKRTILVSAGTLTSIHQPGTSILYVFSNAQLDICQRPESDHRWIVLPWFRAPGYVRIGLIWLIALFGTFAICTHVLGHLRIKGGCRQCGYALQGVVGGKCPECGTVIPSSRYSPSKKA